MKVQVKKLNPEVKLELAHKGDAGIDLYAAETIEILPGEIKLVKTGIKVAIPEGFEGQVRPKSGLALNKGITVLNTPGTIDSGYRGEIGVIIINHGKKKFTAEKKTKIAQLVFNKIELAEIEFVEELDDTSRGEGGFGSTGLKLND
ncbi:MAG: dUTP diphosphatase [Candidatus Diapherotrites archaeon CG10_big_fil_rev_8_21_14_0_10_31_34]|nr:MAG: dUTP diphosphatase [Candidatus Diapherotrites archaeon CG10_big_fil_rev_8_21_14_0_10_31_34]